MKTIPIVRLLMLLLPCLAFAQYSGKELPANRDIGISEQQTTSLLFPYPIVSVDRGSLDILAQKPKGLENILQIKAAQQDFMHSNLTVTTTEGKLYHFRVYYSPEPETMAYDFSVSGVEAVARLSAGTDSGRLDALASQAYHDRQRISLSERDNGITFSITGMFVADDHFFYRVSIDNATNISYTIDQLRFLVRDQKRSRRTASQELEIMPVRSWQQVASIPANSMKSFIVVLPKFTIPDRKNLYMELTEKDGGRHLQMKIRNRKTADVTPLPTFND